MSYQFLFQKAIELQQNGALHEAERIYRQILETAPDNADVLNLLGLIAQTRGIHHEAVSYFYKAAENAPHHFPIYFNLAVSLGALGKFMEAVEAYRKVLQLKPDCKEAFFGIGNLYWQQKNLPQAVLAYQSALTIDSQYIEARTNLYEIQENLDGLEKISKHNPMALYYLGRRAFNNQEFTKAAQYLSRANELTQDDDIKTMLGETFLQTAQQDQAAQLFLQAQNINPHNLTAILNLADIAADHHDFKKAEELYLRAIEIDSKNVRAHANYANMLCQNKRLLEALEQYRHAVIMAPQMPELSYNLALILKTLEDYEQSLDLMFHAFYLAPEQDEWALNIAETLILFHQKAPQKALKIAQNWYQKMPQHIVAQHIWANFNGQESKTETQYNALLFNHFAAVYEQTLQNIQYSVVDRIRTLFPPLSGKILDLGCGTGLVAEKLQNENTKFYGVDIAQNMLSIARTKNVYQDLRCEDITTYMQNTPNDFSTIIAADVFCYFGDLSQILELCFPTRLIFSIESDHEIEQFQVQSNGRYKHNPQDITHILEKIGYQHIQSHSIILRQENGENVQGTLFLAE